MNIPKTEILVPSVFFAKMMSKQWFDLQKDDSTILTFVEVVILGQEIEREEAGEMLMSREDQW